MGSQARAMVWVELLTLVAFSPCLQGQVMPELPNPRMIIVGPTGAGKSSLANAFLGCDPRAPDGTCLFGVCNGMDSCTKETTYGYGPWLGTTPHDFTVVDTPGFGDSDGEDEQLIEEMMGVLSNTISKADTIVLLLNGVSSQRFTDSLVTMIKRMTVMFGQQWWDYLVIGVSFWSYSEEAIAGRECSPNYPDDCKDEAWFTREVNKQMQEKFGVTKNFTCLFLDSWSQTADNIGDEVQQQHWQEETGKLWNITINREEKFLFKTIDDILEENAEQRKEIKWLNDVITNNISQLNNLIQVLNNTQISDIVMVSEQIDTNKEDIIRNSNDIHTNYNLANKSITENKNSIRENKDSIAENIISIDGNRIEISTNQADIARNKDSISTNQVDITSNDKDIESLSKEISEVVSPPLGTIIAWVTRPSNGTSDHVDLPEGWVRCNGNLIPHPSIWAGLPTPDLNGGKKFLRGGSDSSELTMEDEKTRLPDHVHSATTTPHSHSYEDKYLGAEDSCDMASGSYWCVTYRNQSTVDATVDVTVEGVSQHKSFDDETVPANMHVIYIMRVF